MRRFIIMPNDDSKSCKSVDSYIKKAIQIGKEFYGDDFILAEWKEGFMNDFYDTFRRYDCNGNLIYDTHRRI